MTEKIVPYWVGNVAHIRFSSKALHTGPDPMAPVYAAYPAALADTAPCETVVASPAGKNRRGAVDPER